MSRCFFSILLFLLFGCAHKPTPVFNKTKASYQPATEAITIMTYNVENLFDSSDDPGKRDEAFLSQADKQKQEVRAACRVNNQNSSYRMRECLSKDWNESSLKIKMKRLTDVLRQIKGGRGPDVLILQEVENIGVLEKWRTEYLADFGYKPALLIEGPDERGIDVGLLTRLEVTGPVTLHIIPFKANEFLKESEIRHTRGILEANLSLPDGTPLTVMGLHFPSQGAPTETRKQALEFLDSLRAKMPKDRLIVVGGDFNVTTDEEVKYGYMSKMMATNWGVSHLLGCKGCLGTTYYHRNQTWSFFDILLISKNFLPDGTSPWKVLPESIRIENSSAYQTNRFGSPARFDENRKDGVSDHWPMVMEIIKR